MRIMECEAEIVADWRHVLTTSVMEPVEGPFLWEDVFRVVRRYPCFSMKCRDKSHNVYVDSRPEYRVAISAIARAIYQHGVGSGQPLSTTFKACLRVHEDFALLVLSRAGKFTRELVCLDTIIFHARTGNGITFLVAPSDTQVSLRG